MTARRWYFRRLLDALRWQGITGLALTAAAIAFYVAAVAPEAARLSRLQREADSMQELARLNPDAQAAAGSPQARTARFFQMLPARSAAAGSLRIVFAAAHAQTVAIEQGEYKLKLDPGTRLATYEIGLPARGTYVHIRQFIASVLEQIPAAALDELVIKRQTIGEPTIEASIRFTLFLNGG